MSNEAIETEIIGDAAVATDNITPATYFEYVKGMKDKINDTDQQLVIDNILKMIEKCKITNQTAMAKRLAHQAKLAIRELDVASPCPTSSTSISNSFFCGNSKTKNITATQDPNLSTHFFFLTSPVFSPFSLCLLVRSHRRYIPPASIT